MGFYTMANFYLVGGAVRDELLGVKSKDYDYSVEAESYEAMKEAINVRGGEIFLENPEYLTVRAKVPGLGAADYVLCRKDGAYSDGRRPDEVVMGTLHDDLSRRDFTVNAIAKDEGGRLIDPFGGIEHLKRGVLHCVGDAQDRFREDSLRILRALRFSITKGLDITQYLHQCLRNEEIVSGLENVSGERIREELHKMFKHNTLLTLGMLEEYSLVKHYCFPEGLWLMPTFKG
jgi:tRNA nucleotidyltransferase/poly(A) polymerase